MDAFLRKHRTEHTSNATHLSLTGGKYTIRTPSDVHEFRSLYVQSPGRYFIVERVCYPSYFYMDLDRCFIDGSIVGKMFQSRSTYVYTNNQGGYHIIFKSIVVSSPADALNQCDRICQKYPEFKPFVDCSVYTSGLRMIGSKKSMDTQRIYYPLKRRTITINDLEKSSIHYQIQTSKPWSKLVQRNTNEIELNFQNIHPMYSNIKVKDYKQPNHNIGTIITNSTYCPNVNRHHKSRNAYFVVNFKTKQVVHKCLCRCADTQCSKYQSKSMKCLAGTYSIIHNKLLK